MSEASNTAEALVEDGLKLYSQGQLDRALAVWNEALALVPEHPRALEYINYVESNRAALEASFSSAGGSSDESGAGAGEQEQPEAGAASSAQSSMVSGEIEVPAQVNLAADPQPEVASTEIGTELTDLSGDDVGPTPGGAGGSSRASLDAQLPPLPPLAADADPRGTLPLHRVEPAEVDTTARIDVSELRKQMKLIKGDRPTPATEVPRVSPVGPDDVLLEVIPGDDAPEDGGFEPAERTPVAEALPQPHLSLGESDAGELPQPHLSLGEPDAGELPLLDPLPGAGGDEPSPASGTPSGTDLGVDLGDLPEGADQLPDDGRVESMLEGAQQLHEQGTFEGSLWLCERVLAVDAHNAAAKALMERNRQQLLHVSRKRIGDLALVPVVQVPQHEIMWHKLDHRAGFLLSRIDGQLSFEDIIDISGMPEFEVCRILAQLLELGVIGPS